MQEVSRRLRGIALRAMPVSALHSHAVHGDGAAEPNRHIQLYLVPEVSLTTRIKKLTSLLCGKDKKIIDKS